MSSAEALDPSLVQQFVGVAHGDLVAVKTLLRDNPALIKACWDWGGGDFETALGAAAHMGRRDIAEFLLSEGAPLDLFAAAMLGHLAIVQAIIEAQPEAAKAFGAHGIPLLAHAKAGGEGSVAVVQYLESLG